MNRKSLPFIQKEAEARNLKFELLFPFLEMTLTGNTDGKFGVAPGNQQSSLLWLWLNPNELERRYWEKIVIFYIKSIK